MLKICLLPFEIVLFLCYLFLNPFYVFFSVSVRHRNRYIYPSQRIACCSIHSDAKLKDPFSLVQNDLQNLYEDIKKVRSYSVFMDFRVVLGLHSLCLATSFLK